MLFADLKKNFDSSRLSFIFRGILIGILAGFVVSAFRLMIQKMSDRLPGIYHQLTLRPALILPWAALMFLFAVICGWLIKKAPAITGSGIPQVEGQLQGIFTIAWLPVLVCKFLGGVLAIGSGLFLGREGPSIQLGSSVAQGLAETMHLGDADKKIFISAGASAGLSAAFNAPMAGLLFILEEVHHNFSSLVLLTSFASALSANFISSYFFGLKPMLYPGKLPYFPLNQYGHLILLGILLGLFAFLYQKVLLSLPKIFLKIPKLPSNFYGLVPFMLVIPIGLWYPQILGGGNQIILALERQHAALLILIGLFVLRFVFSMISYGSTLPGGIFLPILTLGAILGAIYGRGAEILVGNDPKFWANYIIFGMAAYFAAIGKAPITAIILVTEMVGTVNHLMPLALTSLVAYLVVDMLGGKPIYEALLEKSLPPRDLSISGKKATFEYSVTAASRMDGSTIRDFPWPNNMLVTSIRRGERSLITHGDTVMRNGDLLTIITDKAQLYNVRQELDLRSEP